LKKNDIPRLCWTLKKDFLKALLSFAGNRNGHVDDRQRLPLIPFLFPRCIMKALHSAKPMKKQDCGLSCLFAVFIGFAFALSFFSFSNIVQFAQIKVALSCGWVGIILRV